MAPAPARLALALLVAACCCGSHHAMAASQAATARGAGRKLLACMALDSPKYKPAGGSAVPLCATQYFPAGGQPGQYTRVTPSTPEPMSKANSADMAYAWSQDPVNPRTNSQLQCNGEVDATRKQCWSGKGLETDATFSSISCCHTGVTCYLKSGGCVMR